MFAPKRENSIWGSGPKLLASTVLYFLCMLYIDKTYFNFTVIAEQTGRLYLLAGILLALGSVVWLLIVRNIFTMYKSGLLYKRGFYAFCRHPLYANFILSLVPGFCLLFNSWCVQSTPLFMYFSCRYYLKKEEAGLILQFGEEYRQYRSEVNAILPYKCKKLREENNK